MIEPSSAELSEREKEILRLVATGASNKEIAQRLVISPNTVKVHLRNIFAKIGVASRTEATLYAIQQRYVEMPMAGVPGSDLPAAGVPLPPAPDGAQAQRPRLPRLAAAGLGALVFVVLAVLAGSLAQGLNRPPALTATAPSSTDTAPQRWQLQADLPTARQSFAAAVYDNQIYIAGGTAASGITADAARFNPATNRWEALSPMPRPVTDIRAAAIGGLIYVPGGQQADGRLSQTLAVYDPRRDVWEERAPPPVALSQYALAAFEGKLFLFGGWNGSQYVSSNYRYDPETDTWSSGAPMSLARGLAGAAVSGGKIYVIGGSDGGRPLADSEEYSLEDDLRGEPAWRTRASLPSARADLDLTSIAEIIHLMGGQGPGELPPLAHLPQQDVWQTFAPYPSWTPATGLRLAAVEDKIYVLGGQRLGQPTAEVWAYQAIYSILVPVVQH